MTAVLRWRHGEREAARGRLEAHRGPAGRRRFGSSHYRERDRRWQEARARLQDPGVDRTLLDIWLRERARAFAIETGQIEGLYTLRRGVTGQLIAEGFGGVRAAHALEPGLSDRTLKGLLEDQHAAVELVFEAAAGRRPLSHHTMKSWHQLLTRHQEHAVGIRDGKRVAIPLLRGEYKIRPNNPRRPDGVVHEYCPPEQTRGEMDRLLEMHQGHADRRLPAEVEAAWLHHRFVSRRSPDPEHASEPEECPVWASPGWHPASLLPFSPGSPGGGHSRPRCRRQGLPPLRLRAGRGFGRCRLLRVPW